MRIASSIRSTPTPVMSAVSSGWRNDSGHEAHRTEVVDLVGLDLLDRGDQRRQVAQVAVDELERRVLVDARAGPSGCSGPARDRTPGSPCRSRNSDRWRPSWPVMPVTSARFRAPRLVANRPDVPGSLGVTRSQSGSSWCRNSPQRSSSSVSPIAAAASTESVERPEEAAVGLVRASARSPSHASPTGAAGRGRGGSRPGSTRTPRRRRARAGPAGPSRRGSAASARPPSATASRRALDRRARARRQRHERVVGLRVEHGLGRPRRGQVDGGPEVEIGDDGVPDGEVLPTAGL